MDVDAAISLLGELGFHPDGQTSERIASVPTQRSPRFGSSGGELKVFGRRQRYILPGSYIRATVGPRTTNIYRVTRGETTMLLMSQTKDLTREELITLVAEKAG